MVKMWSSHRELLPHLVDDSAADHYKGAHFSLPWKSSTLSLPFYYSIISLFYN